MRRLVLAAALLIPCVASAQNPVFQSLTTSGPATIGGTLGVTGPATIGGTLGVTGNITGPASSATVTAGGITNTLATWMSYLTGTANPNPMAVALPSGSLLALSTTQNLTGSPGAQYFANNFYIASDTMALGNNFGVGWEHGQLFGGSAVTGGRVAVNCQLTQTGATSSTNPNRNYVCLQGGVVDGGGDGGTSGAEKGAYFGASSYFRCSGTYDLECAGGEVNSYALTGSSMKYKALWTLVGGGSTDVVQGYMFDTMLALSDQTGDVGHQSGILIGPMNGQFPITATGTIMLGSSYGIPTPTLGSGIDFSALHFTGNAFVSQNFRVDGAGNIYGASANLTGPLVIGGQITLASSTTGTASQTFTNSPCTGLTTEKWVPIAITGQTGTFYVPACQ